MKKLLLLLIIAFIIPANSLFAQETFTEVLNLSEKKLSKHFKLEWRTEKDWTPDTKYGQGTIPDLSRLDLKKIALVTYTIFAPITTSKMMHTTTHQFLTESGIDYYANKLYNESIGEIKETFEEGGIELITIDDMSDKQKQILADATGKTWLSNLDNKNNKMSKKLGAVNDEGSKVGVTVEGYKNWTISRRIPVYWTNNMIAEIANALEVDAVLLIANELSPLQKKILYINTVFTIIGKNPTPKVEGKTYPGLSYATGMWYSQYAFDSEEIEIATIKKGDVTSENYEDFDVIMGMLTRKMLESIEINTKKSQIIYDKKH